MITTQDSEIARRIKAAFLRGERLTTLTGNRLAHTVDFRKYVSTLRRRGLLIQSDWVKTSDGRRYKEYYINI